MTGGYLGTILLKAEGWGRGVGRKYTLNKGLLVDTLGTPIYPCFLLTTTVLGIRSVFDFFLALASTIIHLGHFLGFRCSNIFGVYRYSLRLFYFYFYIFLIFFTAHFLSFVQCFQVFA